MNVYAFNHCVNTEDNKHLWYLVTVGAGLPINDTRLLQNDTILDPSALLLRCVACDKVKLIDQSFQGDSKHDQ